MKLKEKSRIERIKIKANCEKEKERGIKRENHVGKIWTDYIEIAMEWFQWYFVWTHCVYCMSNAAHKIIHHHRRHRRCINNGKSSKKKKKYSGKYIHLFSFSIFTTYFPILLFLSNHIHTCSHLQRPNIIYLSIFPLLISIDNALPGMYTVCTHFSFNSIHEHRFTSETETLCIDSEYLICLWHRPTCRYKIMLSFVSIVGRLQRYDIDK